MMNTTNLKSKYVLILHQLLPSAVPQASSVVGDFFNADSFPLSDIMEIRPSISKKYSLILIESDHENEVILSAIYHLKNLFINIPIVVLSTSNTLSFVLATFEAGARDFLYTPMHELELSARLKAHFGISTNMEDLLQIGTFTLDKKRHLLLHEKENIPLSFRESMLLCKLYEQRNQLISREYFIQELWNGQTHLTGRSLDTFMSRLRKKLDFDPSILIVNVRGMGYKMII